MFIVRIVTSSYFDYDDVNVIDGIFKFSRNRLPLQWEHMYIIRKTEDEIIFRPCQWSDEIHGPSAKHIIIFHTDIGTWREMFSWCIVIYFLRRYLYCHWNGFEMTCKSHRDEHHRMHAVQMIGLFSMVNTYSAFGII